MIFLSIFYLDSNYEMNLKFLKFANTYISKIMTMQMYRICRESPILSADIKPA